MRERTAGGWPSAYSIRTLRPPGRTMLSGASRSRPFGFNGARDPHDDAGSAAHTALLRIDGHQEIRLADGALRRELGRSARSEQDLLAAALRHPIGKSGEHRYPDGFVARPRRRSIRRSETQKLGAGLFAVRRAPFVEEIEHVRGADGSRRGTAARIAFVER